MTSLSRFPHLSVALCTLACGSLFSGALQAQDVMTLPRIDGPVTLDGFSQEPAWQRINPLEVTMNQPTFGLDPSEVTEILVAYDDDYLYVAGRLYDSDPEGIQRGAMNRDNMSPSNDWFGIILDTFNDNENGLGFFTTPAGIRFDAAVFNDAQGEFPVNVSWNTFWDVAVKITDQGWFAEMRIPFSSLRFQDTDGQVTMGLTAWRYIARKFETVTFPAISPKWGFWSVWKPSLAQRVRLEGVYSRNPLYVTPYALGGTGQSSKLNDDETAWTVEQNPARDIGLDVKYSLSSNLTLDLTLNTDFAQVEADDEQVNLTRFSLFFPEKRLFFQERSSIFDFSLGGPNRLFYSRSIGLSDYGLVPILGGVRLVGRLGDWDIGGMNMQTAQTAFSPEPDSTVTVASENFGVLRLRRQVLNPYSYAGGMVTSRIGTDGHRNLAYALDGILRLFGDDYLTLNWAQTADTETTEPILSLATTRFRLNWERRTKEGLGFDLSVSRQGMDYNPGMGFVPRTNYTLFRNEVSYGWFPDEDSPIFSHSLSLLSWIFLNNTDGRLESAEVGSSWWRSTKSGVFTSLGLKLLHESITDTFRLSSDSFISPDTYTFTELSASYQSPFGGLFRVETYLNGGTFYDGHRLSLRAVPAWVISKYFEASGSVEFNRVRFPQRDQRFDSNIVRLRLKTTLSAVLSLFTFIQYNSATDAIVFNGRFRFNPREGTDLYIVYNEGINTNRHSFDPALPFTDTRTVLVKYSTTFLTDSIVDIVF
ncbi:MAG: DUF5916 domain-containing protein [Fidelibacterota bacterium]